MAETQPREANSTEAARERAAQKRFREIISGDIDIRIARDGTWFHEGSPINRPSLVKLFAGILKREADGEYYLETPAEKRRITVDDAPFVAVEVTAEGAGDDRRLSFRTNVGDVVTAGPDHPIRVAFDAATGEPSPYVMVRGGMEALIARPVYYDLVDMGETRGQKGGEVLGVTSGGAFFVLGRMGDDA
jgi:hypothetical protein